MSDSDFALRLASPAELREMVQTLTRERDEARAEVEELRTRTAAQLEIETRARDEARADAARLRRALEEATRALAVDPRYLSPARLGTARSILAAALAGEGEVNEEEAIIRDHFFMADPHHPNQCRVHVPVMEAGRVVGTCCGYPAAAHQPTPENARRGEGR